MFVLGVSGFVEILFGILVAQQRVRNVEESVEVVRGASSGSDFAMSWYSSRSEVRSNGNEVEGVVRALQEHRDVGDMEALLPQTIALLLEYPSSPLTTKLAESLIRACACSSQLGLESWWVLQDDESPMAQRLARDCWRVSAREGSRDTAALVGKLVQISETLSKVDRSKRREKGRLRPLLDEMNLWLQDRHTKGVRVPLYRLDSGRQLRVLQIDVDSSSVMPSRARAPTLLFCEALDLPEDDQDLWSKQKYVDLNPSRGVLHRTAVPSANFVVSAATLRRPGHFMATPPSSSFQKTSTHRPQHAMFQSRGGLSPSQHHHYHHGQRPVLQPDERGHPLSSPLLSRVYSPCWREREAHLQRTSRYAALPGWRMASFLVKADDDLRREILAMQAVRLLDEMCAEEHVNAWFKPYTLVCAGRRAGLLETLPDAKSVDFVKSQFLGFFGQAKDTCHLGAYFDAAYPDPKDRQVAAHNFAISLASYSLVCYALDVKDRHNGNILLTAAGHLIHIDFGYILGRTPGNINFEDAPFKLTDDYVDVLLGFHSPAWLTFMETFTNGLHALYKHHAKLHALLTLFFLRGNSPRRQHALHLNFVNKFRDLDGRLETTARVANGLVREALASERTKQYDWYQWKTNGYVM